MNETKKPDVQQEELNIVSTPEEAVDATTIEQIEQNSNKEEANMPTAAGTKWKL